MCGGGGVVVKCVGECGSGGGGVVVMCGGSVVVEEVV